VNLASKHRHLMTQDHDLDGQIGVTAEDESDQLEDAAVRPVKEREGHRWILAAPRSSSQPIDDILGTHRHKTDDENLESLGGYLTRIADSRH